VFDEDHIEMVGRHDPIEAIRHGVVAAATTIRDRKRVLRPKRAKLGDRHRVAPQLRDVQVAQAVIPPRADAQQHLVDRQLRIELGIAGEVGGERVERRVGL
jgi:hypothetical protein